MLQTISQSNLQEVDVKLAAQVLPDLYEDVRRNEGRTKVFCHRATNISQLAGDLKCKIIVHKLEIINNNLTRDMVSRDFQSRKEIMFSNTSTGRSPNPAGSIFFTKRRNKRSLCKCLQLDPVNKLSAN